MTASRDPDRAPAPDLPESGRQLQPILWGVVEQWHAREDGIATWEDAERLLPPRHEDWEALVERLQLVNTFQWHEEDRSRDPAADDAALAAVKRSIDASNSRRVATVAALDDLIHDRLRRGGRLNDAAPLHSETPGSIVDRLTVLALKVYHVKAALTEARRREPAAGQTPDDAELQRMHERLRSLSEQMVDLTVCLDRLLADLREGRAAMKLYRQVKVYGDPRGGGLRAEPL